MTELSTPAASLAKLGESAVSGPLRLGTQLQADSGCVRANSARNGRSRPARAACGAIHGPREPAIVAQDAEVGRIRRRWRRTARRMSPPPRSPRRARPPPQRRPRTAGHGPHARAPCRGPGRARPTSSARRTPTAVPPPRPPARAARAPPPPRSGGPPPWPPVPGATTMRGHVPALAGARGTPRPARRSSQRPSSRSPPANRSAARPVAVIDRAQRRVAAPRETRPGMRRRMAPTAPSPAPCSP